jgi:putative membrane protein
LVAVGVALEALALPLQPALRFTASMILLALGLIVPPLAWLTWISVERALRESAPLPSSKIGLPLAIGISFVAALLLASILLR